VAASSAVRRLTPTECEALMGWTGFTREEMERYRLTDPNGGWTIVPGWKSKQPRG
jgi:hypothetical protein